MALDGRKPAVVFSLFSQSSRYITYASTYPRCGCKNARGRVPTIAKPKPSQSRTARSLLLTTKLNCIARNPRLRARSSECSHIVRATPRPVAADPSHIHNSPHATHHPVGLPADNTSPEPHHLPPRRRPHAPGEPISKRLLSAEISRQRIRLPRPNHRLQHGPDRIKITRPPRTNHEHARSNSFNPVTPLIQKRLSFRPEPFALLRTA